GFALYQFEIKQSLDNQVADNDFFGNFKPDVIEFNDYYPFGMLVPNRNKATTEKHRYRFQGQERDDEVKGEGNSINYTFRIHDPRVGRFLSLDPLPSIYPHNSPYAFSENRVIDGVELEGKEFERVIRKDNSGTTIVIKLKSKVTNDSQQYNN